ncbi:unnamed protein product [Somion occarium]|uniref:Cytochrome P450 n=1 Tax=Somion occarium TaxID=3059160 RepID=A0ABP1E7E9_9APHY
MDDFTEVEECPDEDEDGARSKRARSVSGLRNPTPWRPLRRRHTTGVLQYSVGGDMTCPDQMGTSRQRLGAVRTKGQQEAVLVHFHPSLQTCRLREKIPQELLLKRDSTPRLEDWRTKSALLRRPDGFQGPIQDRHLDHLTVGRGTTEHCALWRRRVNGEKRQRPRHTDGHFKVFRSTSPPLPIKTMSILALGIIACIFRIFLACRIYARRTSSYPPGPPGLPLLGSDIIRLKILGTDMLVLNSLEAATDLLERRSSIYSDRPHLTMMIGLRLVYNPRTIQACHELLKRLATQPERFVQDIRHMTGRVIMMAIYGNQVEPENDHYISIVERGADTFLAIIARSYLVDSVPYLRYLPGWFPGATFLRQAKIWRPIMDALVNEPYQHVKTGLVTGEIHKSAVTSLLESIPTGGKDAKYMEDTMKGTLATIYSAGADTTVSSLVSSFLAMVLYPEVQKAQEAIDKGIGSDRLPDFSDREALPFIEAIMNEVLRWNPITLLNIPHCLTKMMYTTDTFYRKVLSLLQITGPFCTTRTHIQTP